MSELTPSDRLREQSAWYGRQARFSRIVYVSVKSIQIVFAAAIPVVSIAAPGDTQRWGNALLGASIGVLEGFLQLGQFQQNWLLYRATRESLRREEFLYGAKAGPYSGVPSPDTLYYERCDAIMSGENSKWLASQERAASNKASPE